MSNLTEVKKGKVVATIKHCQFVCCSLLCCVDVTKIMTHNMMISCLSGQEGNDQGMGGEVSDLLHSMMGN